MSDEDNPRDGNLGAAKRPSRKRGTGFPVVPLSDAAKILKEAGKYGFEHSLASFAGCMGHKSINSGAFRQRLAAFRDWELVTGRGDSLTMTEVARNIAVPTDEAAERRALQQAFGNCDVFTRLYEKLARGRPLDRERLGAQAVHEFDVSPAKQTRFVKSFVESLVAAQLAEIDSQDKVVLFEPAADDQADERDHPDQEPIAAVGEDSQHTPTTRSSHREPSGALSPTIRQSWQIAGGEIVFELRSEEALPAAVFVTVGRAVEALETLAESLSRPDDSDAADEGG